VLLADSKPIDWILPALLFLAWIAFWVVRRRVPVWFFVVAVLLAILCLPAGMVAGDIELRGTYCTPDNLCFSMNGVHWWINGLLAFLTATGLAFLTPFVGTGVEALHDRWNRTPR
jgi:hypothetical protein